jgi:hypothetical protein
MQFYNIFNRKTNKKPNLKLGFLMKKFNKIRFYNLLAKKVDV